MNDRFCTSVRSALVSLALLGAFGQSACIPDVVIPTCPAGTECSSSEGGAISAGHGGSSAGGSTDAGTRVASSGRSAVDDGNAGAGAGNEGGSDAGGDSSGDSSSGGGSTGGGGLGGGSGAGGLIGVSGLGGDGGAAGDAGQSGLYVMPSELPAPCAGQSYSVSLSVTGGIGPYQWTVGSSAGTWQILPQAGFPDQTHVTLKGEASGTSASAQLTLAVSDGVRQWAQTFSLKPRSSCYFAYVAPEAGQGKLQLLDPLLGVAAPVTLLNNSAAFDFKFSPDGRFLVYRFGQSSAHPKGAHLSLVDLVNPQDQQLLFGEEEVSAFAWSADSRTLAIAFTSGGVGYLGGVRLQVPASGAVQVQPLTKVAASVAADVSWFAGNYVAFYGPPSISVALPGLTDPYFSALTATGFAKPVELSVLIFDSPLGIKTNDVGFYATGAVQGMGSKFYWPTAVDYSITDHANEFVAPSGHFTAELSSASLQIRGAQKQPSDPPLVTSPSDASCPKLLTWAEHRERIACVADVAVTSSVPAHSEIRIFDVNSPATSPLTVSTIQGYCPVPGGTVPAAKTCGSTQYDYTLHDSPIQTRLFSPSGHWLAFTKTTSAPNVSTLYLADLSQNPMVVVRTDLASTVSANTPLVVLAFSPDEQFLLEQQGNQLTLHPLGAAQSAGLQPHGVPATPRLVLAPEAGSACNDDYATNPKQWCGAADRPRQFQWSPDSKLYAYRSLDYGINHLTIASAALYPLITSYPYVAADCGAQCSADFAFQP